MNFGSQIGKVFINTTNSYKFYWWLAIIDLTIKENNIVFSFEKIIFQILAKIWYPVNYYKISLGKQDQLTSYVKDIKTHYGLKDNIKEEDLIQFLNSRKNDSLIQMVIKETTKYVPYRFLRTWFQNSLRGLNDSVINSKIIDLQCDQDIEIPYLVNVKNKSIELNPLYSSWIIENFKLIEAFTYFELIKYLEKNNVNTTNLSIKLFKPQSRKLLKPTILWKEFISKNRETLDCFNTYILSDLTNLSIDHFLPWSFVTHDKLWNLHPIEKNINSSKGNKLPSSKYVKPFSLIQYKFCQFLISKNDGKSLEDYYSLFELNETQLKALSQTEFVELLTKNISPKLEVASNMGFEKNWEIKA